MLKRLILIGVALAAVTGCGDTRTSDQAGADPTNVPGPDYATRVNALCADLTDQVLPITGDKPHPSPQEFLSFGEEIDPVIEEFDRLVDGLEVSQADRPAADAFEAYRSKVDDADAALRKVADAGDADAFDTAFADFLDELRSSPEKTTLSAEGIDCPAR